MAPRTQNPTGLDESISSDGDINPWLPGLGSEHRTPLYATNARKEHGQRGVSIPGLLRSDVLAPRHKTTGQWLIAAGGRPPDQEARNSQPQTETAIRCSILICVDLSTRALRRHGHTMESVPNIRTTLCSDAPAHAPSGRALLLLYCRAGGSQRLKFVMQETNVPEVIQTKANLRMRSPRIGYSRAIRTRHTLTTKEKQRDK